MDRKTRGSCAAALAALGIITLAGCGVENVSTSMESRTSGTTSHTDAAFASAADDSTYSSNALARENPAAQVVEVVNDGPYESRPGEETQPYDPSERGEAPLSDTVVEVIGPSEAEDGAVTPEAEQPAPQVAELESQQAPAALDDKPQAQTEIKFALPSGSQPSKVARSEGNAGLGGVPRTTTIQLAIRPGDAAPLPATSAVTEAEPESRPFEPAPAKSELAPLVVMPRENPRGVSVEPEATIAEVVEEVVEEDVHSLPAQQPLVQAEPPQVAPLQPAAPAVARPHEAVVQAAPQQAAPPAMAAVQVQRSPAMVATLARADERVRHGVQLAEKGALYAARKEFTAAIQLIAQAHDLEHGTRDHSRAAIAGFQAMKEANEFFRLGGGETETARLVAGHKTPVLKGAELMDMPPSIAAQYYYGYAKEQLAAGAGQESVASIALYGLGKIIIAGAGANSQQLEYTGPAMALYQAALISQPQNFRAAHELGVLLAGSGQLELARAMLMGSATVAKQPVIWRNLATVHNRLGEPQLAQQAQQTAEALQATNPQSNAPAVQWVDPATFSRTVPANDSLIPPSAPAAQSTTQTNPAKAPPEPAQPPANVARKRITNWNPLNLRR
jgi:tetratricopeptide (TPR) repeat protein